MINFVIPAFLSALLLLPLVWWILRKFPPEPKRYIFAPFFLLRSLASEPKARQKTPIPLLIFRLMLFALLVLMFARPVYESQDYNASRISLEGSSNAVIVIDDSFAAAANWRHIKSVLDETLVMAKEKNKKLALIKTCGVREKEPVIFKEAEAIAAEIGSIKPVACVPDRKAMMKLLISDEIASNAKVVWFTDGVDYGYLPKTHNFGFYVPAKEVLPLVIDQVAASTQSLNVNIHRASKDSVGEFILSGLSATGAVLFSEQGRFESYSHDAKLEIKIPRDVRARLARLEIAGASHAGAVWLFDSSVRPVALGIISAREKQSQPLLEESYYISNAAAPFAEVENGSAEELIAKGVPLLVQADSSDASEEDGERILSWVQKGGVYLRFAGPRLGERVNLALKSGESLKDALLPVSLRGESRFGGLVNWQKDQTLSDFQSKTPLAAIKAENKITVARMLTFDPVENEAAEVWSSTSDGLPAIVAVREGVGYKILVLTSATPSWSDFALSGVFVEMLKNLAKFGAGVASAPNASATFQLAEKLDGYGNLSSAGDDRRSVKYQELLHPSLTHFHAPGLYGAGQGMVAHNLGGYLDSYQSLSISDAKTYTSQSMAFDFSSLLIPLVALLLMLDMFVNMIGAYLQKYLPKKTVLVALLLLLPAETMADQGNGLKTALAYVVTGNSKSDYISKKGLETLTRELEVRTSATLAPPVGVELARDDITAHQFLYFPLTGSARMTADEVLKLRQFMRLGGLIVIDSADGSDLSTSPYDNTAIAHFLPLLALGQLYQADGEHVLGKTFYLLSELRGKYPSGKVWVEKPDETVNDGVSPVIIGSAGWAETWARDENGNYLFPISGDNHREREMAVRAGINMAVYALTGNYKSDQIHLDAITKRLGK